MIDPGHCAEVAGAVGLRGLREEAVNMNVATLILARLQQTGIEARLTHDTLQTGWNKNNELQNRVAAANQWPADIFVSIHCNSAADRTARGVETYCYKFGGQGEILAKAIHQELVKATNLTNRGVKEAPFYVLRRTDMPAVLIELAFISNPDEETLLASPVFQNKAAEAIARGICNYLGIKLMEAMLTFTDIEGHWAKEVILQLAEKGIFAPAEKFRPDDPLTRAEAAVLIQRILQLLGRL